jgi:hypothetical protein
MGRGANQCGARRLPYHLDSVRTCCINAYDNGDGECCHASSCCNNHVAHLYPTLKTCFKRIELSVGQLLGVRAL